MQERSLLEFRVFRQRKVENFESLGHLREGLRRKYNIWLLVDSNLVLANALFYHARRKGYGLQITLLFHLFFDATRLETGSKIRL